MPKEILVIALGGMMDAKLHQKHERDIELKKESQVPKALEYLNLIQHCDFANLSKRNGKKFDIPDLITLCKIIDERKGSKIIITCEKELMPKLAEALPRTLKNKTATIIFTTANIPLANGTLGLTKSDGFDNLKIAAEALQQTTQNEKGITTKVVQHGKIIPTKALQYDSKTDKLNYKEKVDHSFIKSYAERASKQMSKL